MMQKTVNFLIAILSLSVAIIAYLYKDGQMQIILCALGGVIFLIFLFQFFKKELEADAKEIANIETEKPNLSQITELALLNEEDTPISYWQMYGKSSLVIGIDTGENHVDVNLLNTTYASTVDVEHALLNYSGGNWYIEDNTSKNGVSIIKSDGKKYKLNNAKPCLVEKGDIIYISLAKLKIC